MKKQIADLYDVFQYDAEPIMPTRWQAFDVANMPEAKMMEMLHVNLDFKLGHEDLPIYRDQIQPNLPWADDHFEERVCGYPINPGIEWKNWPWGSNAEKSLDKNGMFNHNYMERYWPKYAGWVEGPTHSVEDHLSGMEDHSLASSIGPNRGIRHQYGDLGGLVRSLVAEPDTRQAYLPVWFPEDTGDAHFGRKPCTLGYHFIMRNNKLDVVYYLRSCDFAHHFRDDMYLTVRLLLWVLERARKQNVAWEMVKPGRMVVQITSLHMFINDFRRLYGSL